MTAALRVMLALTATSAFMLPANLAQAACVGDCGNRGTVGVDDLVTGVHIALRLAEIERCRAFDTNANSAVEVHELVMGVDNALNECPPEPTGTPTLTPTPAVVTLTPVVTTPTPLSPDPRCGDGMINRAAEECDPPQDAACPGVCDDNCLCTIDCPAPTITSVTPKTGSVGTPVTVIGTNLDCGGTTRVQLSCGPQSLTVTALSPTQLQSVIPPGASDCLLKVTTPGGMFTVPDAERFDVVLTRDFSLATVPPQGSVVQGSSTTFTVTAAGSDGFSNLVALGISGLPAGISATLSGPTITAGGSVSLTIGAAANAAVTGPFINFTINGTTQVDGVDVVRSTAAQLAVVAGGRTGIIGQFVLLNGPPLAGVVLQLDGDATTTDAGGNFQFLDVTPGKHTMSVDATPADPRLPIYGIDLVAVAGEITRFDPFKVCPPLPPERYTPIDNMQADQAITDVSAPGAVFTLPAGVTITGWDGQPKTQMTIQKLGIDELPVPPPPGVTRSLYQPFFGTPMGGLPTAPIPVTLPNDLELDPGEKAELWSYDAAPFAGQPGEWRRNGTGTVSADGSQIVSDPGVGITRFCGVCGLSCFVNKQQNQNNRNPDGPTGGDPVDLAIGQMIVDKTDLILPGRIPAIVTRTYNPLDPFAVSRFQLGLGPGWFFSVDVVLQEENDMLRRVVLPGNSRFAFTRQANGTFVNDDHPRFAGAVLHMVSNGVHELRFKDGTIWKFTTPAVAGLVGIGLLVEQRDRNDNRLTIDRGGRVQIERIIEPAGRELIFKNEGGHPVEVSDPLGRKVRYSYNGAGRLEVVTDPAGGTTRYSYDAQGRVLTITDPRDITYLTNEYGPDGRVSKQIQADGGEWRFEYEYICRPLVLVAAPGLQAQQISVENPCAPAEFIGLAAVKVTDPLGAVSRTRLDSKGWPVEVTDALGQKTRFERDAKGRATKIIDALGRVRRIEYDGNATNGPGLPTRRVDESGNVQTFDYEPNFNQLSAATDPLGNVVKLEYGPSGRLESIIDPEQNTKPEAARLKMRLSYDAAGQLASFTDVLGNATTFAYDPFGNLTMIRDSRGNTIRRTYDIVSRLISETDPLGHSVRFAYDDLNRTTEIRSGGGVVRLSYDANSNLTAATDANNHNSSFAYDVMDRPIRRTDPLGASETLAYDDVGNVRTYIDRNGQTTTVGYDVLHRRISIASASRTTSVRYDAVGRMVAITDPDRECEPASGFGCPGAVLFRYDAVGRLAEQTTSLGTVSYAYDAAGRRAVMELDGQRRTTYLYDANSRVVGMTQANQSVGFEYDPLGNRTRLSLPGQVSTAYHYDSLSRLVELTFQRDGVDLGNLAYSYDARGNRTGIGGSFGQMLLPEPVDSASYDAADRQLEFGDSQMTYDANGNLAEIVNGDATSTFTWGDRDQLIGFSGPSGQVSFGYDPLGRRTYRRLNSDVVQYVYDRTDVTREVVGGDRIDVLRSPLVDEPLVRDQKEIYLSDALGSIIQLIDSSIPTGTGYSYGPFGFTTKNGSSSNPYQYTGRENDADLYYYRARYYSPSLARFVQEDMPRMGLLEDSNPYAYVRNNPINRVDPTGQLSVTSGSTVRDSITNLLTWLSNFGKNHGNTAEFLIPPAGSGIGGAVTAPPGGATEGFFTSLPSAVLPPVLSELYTFFTDPNTPGAIQALQRQGRKGVGCGNINSCRQLQELGL